MKTLNGVFMLFSVLAGAILTGFAIYKHEWFVGAILMIVTIVALLIYSINKSEK